MTTLTDNYPWLIKPWRQLTSDLDRLPHALLLAGLGGLGKNQFAIKLAEILLCTELNDNHACGNCKSCTLFTAKTHPDIKIVTPAEEGKSISIDQIRELTSFLNLTPHTAGHKVIILTPAEAMTLQAANSLLKQLEEPPGSGVLMLVSHEPYRLPQTIRSRCTRVGFNPPSIEKATLWLRKLNVDEDEISVALSAAGGAPLAAHSLAQQGYAKQRREMLKSLLAVTSGGSPLRCAEGWQKIGSKLVLNWFYGFLLDVLKISLGANESQQLANRDATAAISDAAKSIPANRVTELLEVVIEARRLMVTPVDERLILEDILIRWNKVYA